MNARVAPPPDRRRSWFFVKQGVTANAIFICQAAVLNSIAGGAEYRNGERFAWKKVSVQTLAGTVWLGAMLGLEHRGLEPQRGQDYFSGDRRPDHCGVVVGSRADR